MIDGTRIRHEVRIDAPPEAVFPFLVDAERYARWQGTRAELDARPGGIFRVWMDERTVVRGEYVEVTPPARVVITWGWEGDDEVPPGSSTVEFDLEAVDGGTRLTLHHHGLPNDASAARHDEGWTFFASRLATAASGSDPSPIPPLDAGDG